MSKYGTENVGQGINQPIMAQAASCKLLIISAPTPPPAPLPVNKKYTQLRALSPPPPDIYPPLVYIDLLYDILKLNY